MVLALLAFFLLLSCGSNPQREEIVLKFSSTIEAPFFSKVELFIMGEDFETIELSKEGPFFPGDRVPFEVELPAGSERTFEAIVYDPSGQPVYYGSTVSEVPTDREIVVELKPTDGKVSSFERFSNGASPSGGVEFFLVSSELSRIYKAGITSPEGEAADYLPGTYIAYKEERNKFKFSYVSSREDLKLFLKKRYEIKVSLPPGESFLLLSGSFSGLVEDGYILSVISDKLLKGGLAVVSGLGSSLYLNLSASEVLDFPLEGCFQGDFNCLPLNIQIDGLPYTSYEVYGQRGEIRFLMGVRGSFWKLEGLEYLLKVQGNPLSDGICVGEWSVWTGLGNTFDGSAFISLKPSLFKLELTGPSEVRLWSQEMEANLSCEGSASFILPYMEGGKVIVEAVYDGGRFSGKIVQIGDEVSFSLPEPALKDVEIRETEEYLLIKFARPPEFGECSLALSSDIVELEVDYIPPHRTYLKIRKLWEGKPERGWRAGLVCFSQDRTSFIGLGIPYQEPSLTVQKLP